MDVIPAIDIKNGKVVRLEQGSFLKEKVYSGSPIEIAQRWDSFGVKLIHVVDLDGALEGVFKNYNLIADIAGSIKAGIELGGGLRDEETIAKVFDAGVKTVVIGTKALDKVFLERCVNRFRKKITVGIDAKDGFVHTKGWIFNTQLRAIDLVISMRGSGVDRIIYTDISRDGMLEGPNLMALERLLDSTNMHVVASGGISTFEDLQHLKALEQKGLSGVIIGKALYEGTIDLKEAVSIC